MEVLARCYCTIDILGLTGSLALPVNNKHKRIFLYMQPPGMEPVASSFMAAPVLLSRGTNLPDYIVLYTKGNTIVF